MSTRHSRHLAQRRVVGDEERLVPLAAPLLVDRDVEPAQEVQHAGDDVLGDRDGVDARRVREQDVACRRSPSRARCRRPPRPSAPSGARAPRASRSRVNAEAEVDLRVRESPPSPRRSRPAGRRRRSSSARARRTISQPGRRFGAQPRLALRRERPVLRRRREVDDQPPRRSVNGAPTQTTSSRRAAPPSAMSNCLDGPDELQLEGAILLVLEHARALDHGCRAREERRRATSSRRAEPRRGASRVTRASRRRTQLLEPAAGRRART